MSWSPSVPRHNWTVVTRRDTQMILYSQIIPTNTWYSSSFTWTEQRSRTTRHTSQWWAIPGGRWKCLRRKLHFPWLCATGRKIWRSSPSLWHKQDQRGIRSKKEIWDNQSHHRWDLTFPIASNPLSNNKQTPRNRKPTPNPARPTPISEKVEIKLNSNISRNASQSQ